MASIAGRMNESPVRLAGSAAGDCGDPLPGRDGPGGGGGGSVPSRGAPGCCGLALAADELAANATRRVRVVEEERVQGPGATPGGEAWGVPPRPPLAVVVAAPPVSPARVPRPSAPGRPRRGLVHDGTRRAARELAKIEVSLYCRLGLTVNEGRDHVGRRRDHAKHRPLKLSTPTVTIAVRTMLASPGTLGRLCLLFVCCFF